jgi:hypothetical protein
MIGNTERIYRMINEYTERYESVQDYIHCHQWLDRVIEDTNDLKSSEKILEMSKQRLISLISNFYIIGPGGYRLNKILDKNSFEEIKDAIFILLYGEGELEDRIIMARRSEIGISFLTQALCFFDPKQYSIKDRMSKIGVCYVLGYGEIVKGKVLDDFKGAIPYDDMSYTEFHKLVTEIGKHFILKMLQTAGDEKEHLGKFINSRKYLVIDQFLRFCYSKAR